jgi:hypothetical protein
MADHLKTAHSVFEWSTSLNHFIYEKGIKTFLFHIKWFRLADHLKNGHKYVQKLNVSGIWMSGF